MTISQMGTPGGQHSGDAMCVMRYDLSGDLTGNTFDVSTNGRPDGAVAPGGQAVEDMAFEQHLGPPVRRGEEAAAGRFDFGHRAQRGDLDLEPCGQPGPHFGGDIALQFLLFHVRSSRVRRG